MINIKLFSFERTISLSKSWITVGIIVAVLLASTVIAYWGAPIIYALILVLLGGVLVVTALIRRPNLGFILLFLGGMFVPFRGPSGLNAANAVIALMLGLWIIDMFVVKRNVALIRSPIMIPIAAFLAITFLSFIVGQIPWFVFARQAPLAAQVGGFAIVIFSIGGMLLAAHLIQDVRWLKIIVWAFFGLCSILIIARAARLGFIARFYHFGFEAQSMFWTWLITLAFGQLVFNNKLTRRTQILLAALVLLTFYVAIFQGFEWKSGWFPPFIAACVLLAIRFRKLIIVAIPFVVIAGLLVINQLIASDDYSWGTRVDAWRIILEISRVSPLLGMGFANYYWYTPLFPIRGWRVSFNSHSQYVDLIAQTGYFGLFTFLWLLLAVARLSWNTASQLPDGFARAYAYSVLAGIVGTLVAASLGDWVLPFVYNIGLTGFRASILPWVFCGGVIALEQMLISQSKGQTVDFS